MPWFWSGQSTLLQAFYDEIAAATEATAPSNDAKVIKRAALWRVLGRVASLGSTFAVSASATVAGAHPELAALLLAAGQAAEQVGKATTTGGEALASAAAYKNRSLADLREDLRSGLAEVESRLLIVIDGIDRLTSHENRLIFQLVKTNADMPNTTFLLLYDEDPVGEALNKLVDGRGHEYLKKIIDLSFRVPPINASLVADMAECETQCALANMPEAAEKELREFSRGPLVRLCSNVRDVKRLASSVEFQWSLSHTDGKPLHHPVDLTALEAIRIFEPAVYRALSKSRGLVTTAISEYSADEEAAAKAISA